LHVGASSAIQEGAATSPPDVEEEQGSALLEQAKGHAAILVMKPQVVGWESSPIQAQTGNVAR
jgi:hypothetical protein